MTAKHDHRPTVFECVDLSPQSVPGSSANTNGALFYHTEVKCNYGIPLHHMTYRKKLCV